MVSDKCVDTKCKPSTRYNVGDLVIIKSWDKMAEEYGIVDSKSIDTPYYRFIEDMKPYCEDVFEIADKGAFGYTLSGCGTYVFTDEMIEKKFDVTCDLREGDIIERTCVHVDETYECDQFVFRKYVKVSYSEHSYVEVDKRHTELLNPLSFKLIARPRKETVVEPVKETVKPVGKVTEYDLVKCETIEEIALIASIFSSMGWTFPTEIWNVDKNGKPQYPYLMFFYDRKFIGGLSVFTVSTDLVTMDDVIKRIANPPKKYYKSLFIEAMKETLKEYIDGTHVCSASKCRLCQTVMSIKVLPEYEWVKLPFKERCDVCPWVKMTGNDCSVMSGELSNERIKERMLELIEWIAHYETLED